MLYYDGQEIMVKEVEEVAVYGIYRKYGETIPVVKIIT